MAVYVADRSGPIPLERNEYDVYEFSPAKISVSRPLTIDDLRKRGFGEALYSDTSAAERAARLQLKDLTDMDLSITRREEWMCAQTMINNACTMQEYIDKKTKGNAKHIQFYDGTSSPHEYTIANKWNSAGANIIGDIKAMCGLLAKRGLNAADLVIGPDVEDAIYSDQKICDLLDRNRAVEFGSIDEQIKYPGVSILGTLNFRGYRLTVFVVSTTYEDENGTDTPYFPTDSAMVTFPKCGHLMYGSVDQIPYKSDNFETIADKRVPKFFCDTENDVRKLSLTARPLAAPSAFCPYIYAKSVVG